MNLDDIEPSGIEGHTYLLDEKVSRITSVLPNSVRLNRPKNTYNEQVRYWPPRLKDWRRLEHSYHAVLAKKNTYQCAAWELLKEAHRPAHVSHVFVELRENKKLARVFDGTWMNSYHTISSEKIQHVNNAWLSEREYDEYWRLDDLIEKCRHRVGIVQEAFEFAVKARLRTLWRETYMNIDLSVNLKRTIVVSFSNQGRKYVVRYANDHTFEWIIDPASDTTKLFDLCDNQR